MNDRDEEEDGGEGKECGDERKKEGLDEEVNDACEAHDMACCRDGEGETTDAEEVPWWDRGVERGLEKYGEELEVGEGVAC